MPTRAVLIHSLPRSHGWVTNSLGGVAVMLETAAPSRPRRLIDGAILISDQALGHVQECERCRITVSAGVETVKLSPSRRASHRTSIQIAFWSCRIALTEFCSRPCSVYPNFGDVLQAVVRCA
jgi:hypothetical protein